MIMLHYRVDRSLLIDQSEETLGRFIDWARNEIDSKVALPIQQATGEPVVVTISELESGLPVTYVNDPWCAIENFDDVSDDLSDFCFALPATCPWSGEYFE